ncbi:MAG: hypothetical protein RR202_00390 [Bacteroidales bacterium]
MSTVKDLLLSELTSKGFIYYPELKRLMLKNEMGQISMVTVIEMNDETKCRVYFSQNDANADLKDYTDDRSFSYDAEQILNYVQNVAGSAHAATKFAA